VSVAGTGHDFLNRHTSSDNCVFIRTTFMKGITWSSDKSTVRLGPGLVFDEIHTSAAQNGRLISSGWASTVGIVGWSLGGGHGPFAPGFGLGVDNIVEADVVTAEGKILTVNNSTNQDLYIALRGGGGSTWGVVTSITIKTYPIPSGGFSQLTLLWNGTTCVDDLVRFKEIVNNTLSVSATLDNKWGGLMMYDPSSSSVNGQCGARWGGTLVFVYQGPQTDGAFTSVYNALNIGTIYAEVKSFSNWAQRVNIQDVEYIIPVPWVPNGLPSVLLQRDVVINGTLTSFLSDRVAECGTSSSKCVRHELYHDLTGNLNSPQATQVSISPGFRTALIHYVHAAASKEDLPKYTALGGNSYLSESAYLSESDYTQSGATSRDRYWGGNQEMLQAVKNKYDPKNVFGCHNCIAASETLYNPTFDAVRAGAPVLSINFIILVMTILSTIIVLL
jgi:ribonuclease T2